jgi:predicted metal-dependent enzyme (double-stranded beta helix superfamily)
MIEQARWHVPAAIPMGFLPPSWPTPLSQMLTSIDSVIRSGGASPDRRLAAVLARHVGAPDLLNGIDCQPSRTGYARHLLESGDKHCVIAIAWLPGQMTPVHGHRTWCALGVYSGCLTETNFEHGDHGLTLNSSRQLRAGDLSHAPAGGAIHRIANLGTELAISIHAYGAPYDRLGHDVNDVRET